jgi:hypothetical protein
MLIELNVKPGVYRNGSVREAKGRYYDANLVRWKNGKLKPIGGWEKTTTTAITGKGRTMLPFQDNAGWSYIAVGTSSSLFIYTGSTSTPSDVTPDVTPEFNVGNESSAIGTGFGSGPFNGTGVYKTYTASTISAATSDDSFNDSASGFSITDFKVNDLIQVSGFTGGGSNNNKTYANSHRITAITTAKITVAASNLDDDAAGEAVTISKARSFGEDYSGTALVSSANVWSFDMWGEILIGCSDSDGRIWYWDPSATDPLLTEAALVNTFAPTANTSILVSKERHLIAFGAAGNPKKIQWSTSEDFSTATNSTNNAWYPQVTNSAGSFEIDTTGKIKSAIKVADIILVNTDVDCHEMKYIGPPYIYSRRKIAGSCGIISRQAAAAVTGLAAWMSYDGTFFIYDGSVRPLPCDVSKHIADDMNRVQSDVFYASANSLNNEIWWFYVSSSGSDIDRYVIWNYAENWWSIGELERTAFTDIGVFKNPLGVSTDGFIYEHEKRRVGSEERGAGVQDPSTLTLLSQNDRTLSFGLSSASSNEMTFAETGAFEVGIGERFANIKTMMTDTISGDNALSFKVYSALNSDSTETVSSSYSLGTDGYTHLRETGRHLRLKILAPFDQDFEIGPFRVQVSAGGKR